MKKYAKPAFIFLLLLLCFVFFTNQSVFAQDDPGGIVPCGKTAGCTLCHLIIGFERIFKYLVEILFTVTMVFIVVAGVIYMVSGGSKSMMEKAKQAITLALTGFILFLCSWLLIGGVLTALGYKQVGSWWTFDCDTTQTTGPVSSGSSSSSSSSSSSASFGKGCAAVVQNINAMQGWQYTSKKLGNLDKRYTDGYGDCSSTTERAYTRAGCKSPGSGSETIYNNAKPMTDPSTIKAGDALVRMGHVGICLTDGCTQIMGASTKGGIRPGSGSSMLNTPGVRIIRASDLCPDCK
jgi:hypothetical protein